MVVAKQAVEGFGAPRKLLMDVPGGHPANSSLTSRSLAPAPLPLPAPVFDGPDSPTFPPTSEAKLTPPSDTVSKKCVKQLGFTQLQSSLGPIRGKPIRRHQTYATIPINNKKPKPLERTHGSIGNIENLLSANQRRIFEYVRVAERVVGDVHKVTKAVEEMSAMALRRSRARTQNLERVIKQLDTERNALSEAMSSTVATFREKEDSLRKELQSAHSDLRWADSARSATRQFAEELEKKLNEEKFNKAVLANDLRKALEEKERLKEEASAKERLAEDLRRAQAEKVRLEKEASDKVRIAEELLRAESEKATLSASLQGAFLIIAGLKAQLDMLRQEPHPTSDPLTSSGPNHAPQLHHTTQFQPLPTEPIPMDFEFLPRLDLQPEADLMDCEPTPPQPSAESPTIPPYVTNPTSAQDFLSRYDLIWGWMENPNWGDMALRVGMVPWPVLRIVASPNEITFDDVTKFYYHYFRQEGRLRNRKTFLALENTRWHPDNAPPYFFPRCHPTEVESIITGVLSVCRLVTELFQDDTFLNIASAHSS
ncbi:hypothetical protein ABKN59_003755 [Abortiporus biennis]